MTTLTDHRGDEGRVGTFVGVDFGHGRDVTGYCIMRTRVEELEQEASVPPMPDVPWSIRLFWRWCWANLRAELRGGKLSGKVTDGLWMESTKVNAPRRRISTTWTTASIVDFGQLDGVEIKIGFDASKLMTALNDASRSLVHFRLAQARAFLAREIGPMLTIYETMANLARRYARIDADGGEFVEQAQEMFHCLDRADQKLARERRRARRTILKCAWVER